jgi:hypothetical protein
MKTTLLLIAACLLGLNRNPSGNGQITGTITYQHHDQGKLPDSNSTVYFLDSTLSAKINFKALDILYQAVRKNFRNRLLYESDSIADALTYPTKDSTYKYVPYKPIVPVTEMNKYQFDAFKAIKEFMTKAASTHADSKGTYSKTLTPGFYCIMIESANVESYLLKGSKDKLGQLFYGYVTIKPNSNNYFDNYFLHESTY